MATKKAGGSTKNGRDSSGKRLGVKRNGGELVRPGQIILKQRGSEFLKGCNTSKGRDHTIWASSYGRVFFIHKKNKKVVLVI